MSNFYHNVHDSSGFLSCYYSYKSQLRVWNWKHTDQMQENQMQENLKQTAK